MSDVPPPLPEPPAPPPPPPAAPEAAPPPKDTVGSGLLRLLLLHFFQIPLSVVGGPLWIGLSQLVYVVPQHFAYAKRGQRECLRGLWIGAGVTFLLNAGCFGIVMFQLSHTSFR
jgi:hypothetical protein